MPVRAGAPARASAANRERTAASVHRAAGAGMLSIDETEEHLSADYRARFGAELVVAALVISLVVNGLGALGGGDEFHGPHVAGD